MPFYLHAYIKEPVTGVEKPVKLDDPRAGFRQDPPPKAGAAGIPAAAAVVNPNALSLAAVKAEINSVLKQFPLLPEPKEKKRLNSEIKNLRLWAAHLDAQSARAGGGAAAAAAAAVAGATDTAAAKKRKRGNTGRARGSARKKQKLNSTKPADIDVSLISAAIRSIKPEDIEGEIQRRYREMEPAPQDLAASFIPFENGEICLIHRNGKPRKLPGAGKFGINKRQRATYDSLAVDLGSEQRKAVTWDLLAHLDEFLGEVSYKITTDSDGKVPVKGKMRKKAPAAAAPAAVSATAVPAPTVAPAGATFTDIPVLSSLKRIPISNDSADYAYDDSIKKAAKETFLRTMSKGWPGIFRCFTLDADVVFGDAATAKKIPANIKQFFSQKNQKQDVFPTEKLQALWIPYELGDYFYEEPRDGTRVVQKSGDFWREDFPTGDKKPDCCVYRVVGNQLFGKEYCASVAPSPGGGGGMRSDNPIEADYRWTAEGLAARSLGLSLGLEEKCRIAPSADWKDFEVRLPKARESMRTAVAAGMNSEIRYWKKFGETPVQGKKNRPKESKPLHGRTLVRADAATLYTKKRKGGWSGARRPPVPIKGSLGDREGAGDVMQQAFRELGIFPTKSLESATDFAVEVVQTGKAKQTWENLSVGAQPWKGVAAAMSDDDKPDAKTATLRAGIRTDQEWCHLIGHGDGGNETFDNFISGSQHCNTEQLAIETGQRTGRASYSGVDEKSGEKKSIDLAVKVTGYLFPSDPKLKNLPSIKLPVDKLKPLKLLKPDEKNPTPKATSDAIVQTLVAYDAYKKALKSAQGLAAVDPVKALLSDTSKPTLAEWQEFEDEMRASYLRSVARLPDAFLKYNKMSEQIMEELQSMLFLPPLPLGNFVRYKIFFKDDEGKYQKIFDHTFDAQKESLDFFEYKIIESTVRRVIAVAAEREHIYRAAIKRKVERMGVQMPAAAAAAGGANG